MKWEFATNLNYGMDMWETPGLKMFELGSPWVCYNHFARRIIVLDLRKLNRTTFNHIRVLSQSVESKKITADASVLTSTMTPHKALPPAQPLAQPPVSLESKNDVPASTVPKQATNTKTNNNPKGKPSDGDPGNREALKVAQILNTKFHKTVSMHSARLASLNTEHEWTEVRADVTTTRLEALWEDLVMAISAGFSAKFLSMDTNNLKNTYVNVMGDFWQEVRGFNKTITEPLHKVGKWTCQVYENVFSK